MLASPRICYRYTVNVVYQMKTGKVNEWCMMKETGIQRLHILWIIFDSSGYTWQHCMPNQLFVAVNLQWLPKSMCTKLEQQRFFFFFF